MSSPQMMRMLGLAMAGGRSSRCDEGIGAPAPRGRGGRGARQGCRRGALRRQLCVPCYSIRSGGRLARTVGCVVDRRANDPQAQTVSLRSRQRLVRRVALHMPSGHPQFDLPASSTAYSPRRPLQGYPCISVIPSHPVGRSSVPPAARTPRRQAAARLSGATTKQCAHPTMRQPGSTASEGLGPCLPSRPRLRAGARDHSAVRSSRGSPSGPPRSQLRRSGARGSLACAGTRTLLAVGLPVLDDHHSLHRPSHAPLPALGTHAACGVPRRVNSLTGPRGAGGASRRSGASGSGFAPYAAT
jgi:hypothetical protein